PDGTPVQHGTTLALGDGSGAACPCNNFGQAGAGCANSTGFGATLRAFGSTSVASDTLYFKGDHLPPRKVTLLLSSPSSQAGGLGIPVSDGLLGCGAPAKRLAYNATCDDGSSWWGSGMAPFETWQPGDTRYFQVWYRDLQGPCGGASNFSPAVAISFTP
ncbi:MAG: hypothetical protein ABI054_12815, partial [Planctomycetota bacterium]